MKSRIAIGAALLGLVSALILAATYRVPAAVKIDQVVESSNEYAEPAVLIEKANALGKSEIARLAAAEMIYRNKVYIHAFQLDGSSGQPIRLFMKLYRQFTGYEVVDIERSSSVLRPLKISIRFNYDRIGTRDVKGNTGDTELRSQVEADVAFITHDSESIVREYPCNAQGEVVKLPSPVLDRPNFWWKNGREPYGVAWIEDPYAPPGSY